MQNKNAVQTQDLVCSIAVSAYLINVFCSLALASLQKCVLSVVSKSFV